MQSETHHGVWRSLVARVIRDDEVAGSIPVTPTIECGFAEVASKVGAIRQKGGGALSKWL